MIEEIAAEVIGEIVVVTIDETIEETTDRTTEGTTVGAFAMATKETIAEALKEAVMEMVDDTSTRTSKEETTVITLLDRAQVATGRIGARFGEKDEIEETRGVTSALVRKAEKAAKAIAVTTTTILRRGASSRRTAKKVPQISQQSVSKSQKICNRGQERRPPLALD